MKCVNYENLKQYLLLPSLTSDPPSQNLQQFHVLSAHYHLVYVNATPAKCLYVGVSTAK